MIYLSAPYSNKHWWLRLRNIYRTWRYAARLCESGFVVFTPNLNTAFFEYVTNIKHSKYVENDKEFLKYCDTIILMPNWERSLGCQKEYWEAKKLGLKIIKLNK